MASELRYRHSVTGLTVYALLRNASGQVWNTDSAAFETQVNANWTDYDISLAESPASGYYYVGNMPAAAAGDYTFDVYSQAGGSPAITDAKIAQAEPFEWNGSAVVDPLPHAAADAAGGLPISDAGGLDLDAILDVAVSTRAPAIRTTWFVASGGNDGNTGLTWDQAFATIGQAITSASAGDVIQLGAGTWALGNAGIVIPDYCTLRGLGMEATFITSTAEDSTACIVQPGKYSVCEDLTIKGLDDSVIQAPFGQYKDQADPAEPSFEFATIRRCRLEADSDGIYLRGNSSSKALHCELVAEDCVIQTKWDAVGVLGNGNMRLSLIRPQIWVTGPSAHGGYDGYSSGIRMHCFEDVPQIAVHGGMIHAEGGTTGSIPVRGIGQYGTCTLYGVSISSADDSTGLDVMTTYRSGDDSTNVVMIGCRYNPSKMTLSGADLYHPFGEQWRDRMWSLPDWLRQIARSDFSDDVSADQLNGGTGHPSSYPTPAASGDFSASGDALEAIRDRGDAAWIAATGFATAAVCTEARLAELDAANLPADVDAILDDTETDGVVLASSEDVYHADIDLTIDDANSQDEYTVQWIKNGAPVTSGITVPKIQVVKRADGTDLIAATAMTQIGSTGSYKYTEATNRITAGEAVVVVVTATIDSATRTWKRPAGRDA